MTFSFSQPEIGTQSQRGPRDPYTTTCPHLSHGPTVLSQVTTVMSALVDGTDHLPSDLSKVKKPPSSELNTLVSLLTWLAGQGGLGPNRETKLRKACPGPQRFKYSSDVTRE